jgi:hypothetical protein
MGVWIGGLIAKLKLIKAKSKIKYNQNQKKSKCINYWIAFLDVNSILILILTVGSILI